MDLPGAFKFTGVRADLNNVKGLAGRSKLIDAQRGASLVEYSLALALILVITLAAVTSLTEGSGTYLSQTGNDIGRAPDHVADLEPSLPDPPDWVGP